MALAKNPGTRFWKFLQPLLNTEYRIVILLLSTRKNSFDLDFEGQLSAKEAAVLFGLFMDKNTFNEYVHVWIQIKWNRLAACDC